MGQVLSDVPQNDIFLSYAREDRSEAEALVEHLEALGWSVWWDRTIPAGRSFDEVIEEEIDSARCVVVLWSKSSVTSRWVREEAAEGAHRGMLVPVQIEEVSRPLGFRRIQTADLTGWDGEPTSLSFERLVDDLVKVLGPPPAEASEDAELDDAVESRSAARDERQPDPNEVRPGAPWKRVAGVRSARSLDELFRWVESPYDGRVELWRGIPAGSFTMGDTKQGIGFTGRLFAMGHWPRHTVVVRSPFRLAAVPVTVAQYRVFDPEYRPSFEGAVPDEDLLHCPVLEVTWEQAMSFCRWLGETLPWARGARLPTEEEWEYACRAGTQTRYWSGDEEEDLDRVAWYRGNSGDRPHRVAVKPANPWGLYDMHGNAWEWTLSAYSRNYQGREGGIEIDPPTVTPESFPLPPDKGRVIRGGHHWNLERIRAASRDHWPPEHGWWGLGFRVLLPESGG